MKSGAIIGLIFKKAARQCDRCAGHSQTVRDRRDFFGQRSRGLIEQRAGIAIPFLRGGKNALRIAGNGRLACVTQQKRNEFIQRRLARCFQIFASERGDFFLRVVADEDIFEAAPGEIVGAAAIGEKMAPAPGFFGRTLKRFLARDVGTGSGDNHDSGAIAKSCREDRARVFHDPDRDSARPGLAKRAFDPFLLGDHLAAGESSSDRRNISTGCAGDSAEKLTQRDVASEAACCRGPPRLGRRCDHQV